MKAPEILSGPHENAVDITGRDYLSFSQINMFRNCPRRYAFCYVEHIPPEFVPVSLAFGQAIHAGIAMACQISMSLEDYTLDDMLESYHSSMNKTLMQDPDLPLCFSPSHPDTPTMEEQAIRIFQAFIDSGFLDDLTILAVEEAIRGNIAKQLPVILCYADLIVETDEQVRIIDFKTSRSKWKAEDLRYKSDQLLLYRLLGQSMLRELGKPMHLEYVVLTKNKKPIIQQFEVQVDHTRLRRLESSFRQVWQAIQTHNFYPVPSPMNCSTCQWKSQCEAHG